MTLTIIDMAWGIDRRIGEKMENEVARQEYDINGPGELAPIGPSKQVFRIDEVGESSLTISVMPKGKVITVSLGKPYTYRPLSLDGGHFYILNLE